MENSTVRILNQQMIHDIIVGTEDSEQVADNLAKLKLFALLPPLLGMVISIVASSIIPFLFSLVLAFPLFSAPNTQSSMNHAVSDGDYRIYTDVCLDKKAHLDSEAVLDTYQFLLEQRGWQALPMDSWSIYDLTEPGDTVYLLWIPEDKIIRWFHGKTWMLDNNEFTLKEDYYIPVKQQEN